MGSSLPCFLASAISCSSPLFHSSTRWSIKSRYSLKTIREVSTTYQFPGQYWPHAIGHSVIGTEVDREFRRPHRSDLAAGGKHFRVLHRCECRHNHQYLPDG